MQPGEARSVVLVTGATGFIGMHVARVLRARGHEVRALVRRDPATLPNPSPWDVTLRGDVLEPDSLVGAVDGVDAVVHCAGLTGPAHPRAAYHRVNVEGTRHLLDAAVEGGVRRFVYVSSVGVYAVRAPGPICEDDAGRFPGDPYGDSKLRAEAMVLHAGRRAAIDVGVVRPAIVCGPGDTGFLPFVLAARSRGRFGLIDGGKGPVHLVHVEDLAELLLRCVEASALAGRVFNACGPDALTWRELVAILDERAPGPAPKSVPRWAALSVASMVELGAALRLTSRVPVTRNLVRAMTLPVVFDGTRAARELGWVPRRRSREALDGALQSLGAPSEPGARGQAEPGGSGPYTASARAVSDV